MKAINTNAPVKTVQEIIINASPEKVWSILSDFQNWETWNSSVKNVSLKGLLQSGTAFSWKSAGMQINSIIHIAEAPSLLGWTGKALGTFAIHNWRIQPSGTQTKVIMGEGMEGFLARLVKKSLQKTLDKGSGQWLNELKAAAEEK